MQACPAAPIATPPKCSRYLNAWPDSCIAYCHSAASPFRRVYCPTSTHMHCSSHRGHCPYSSLHPRHRSLPLPLPHIALPHIALPRIALPRIALPRITLPRVALPSVALSSVALPRVPYFASPYLISPYPTGAHESPCPNLQGSLDRVPRAAPYLSARTALLCYSKLQHGTMVSHGNSSPL